MIIVKAKLTVYGVILTNKDGVREVVKGIEVMEKLKVNKLTQTILNTLCPFNF